MVGTGSEKRRGAQSHGWPRQTAGFLRMGKRHYGLNYKVIIIKNVNNNKDGCERNHDKERVYNLGDTKALVCWLTYPDRVS